MAEIYYLQNRRSLYVLSSSQLVQSIATGPVKASGPFLLVPSFRKKAQPPGNGECSKILPDPDTYVERLWDKCRDLRRL
jgi:hypothetical protein